MLVTILFDGLVMPTKLPRNRVSVKKSPIKDRACTKMYGKLIMKLVVKGLSTISHVVSVIAHHHIIKFSFIWRRNIPSDTNAEEI